MRCPLCFQTIHDAAESCPHCGIAIDSISELYSDRARSIDILNDEAGMLRVGDRVKVKRWIDKFHLEFPQCFLSVSLVALNDAQDIRSYGVWALSDQPIKGAESKDSAFGVMLVIDVKKKEAVITYGYQLEPYMSEKRCFDAISCAHPFLLDGQYVKAIEVMRHGIRKMMRKNVRSSRKMLKIHKISLKGSFENEGGRDE